MRSTIKIIFKRRQPLAPPDSSRWRVYETAETTKRKKKKNREKKLEKKEQEEISSRACFGWAFDDENDKSEGEGE